MTQKKPTEQWISFTLGSEIYVHAIDTVREIIPYSRPVPVPGTAAEVEGVLNVRGEVVPILSGRTLLELGDEPPDEHWRIIILEIASGLTGLCVDAVREIVTFPAAAIEPNGQVIDGGLVKGTFKHGEALLIPLDLSDYCKSHGENRVENG